MDVVLSFIKANTKIVRNEDSIEYIQWNIYPPPTPQKNKNMQLHEHPLTAPSLLSIHKSYSQSPRNSYLITLSIPPETNEHRHRPLNKGSRPCFLRFRLRIHKYMDCYIKKLSNQHILDKSFESVVLLCFPSNRATCLRLSVSLCTKSPGWGTDCKNSWAHCRESRLCSCSRKKKIFNNLLPSSKLGCYICSLSALPEANLRSLL